VPGSGPQTAGSTQAPVRSGPGSPRCRNPTAKDPPMPTGTIVRDRGFGFIKEETGNELFFHATGVTGGTAFDHPAEGQRVTYDKGRDERGRGDRATNVQPA
jgi:cold shock CspA family protein